MSSTLNQTHLGKRVLVSLPHDIAAMVVETTVEEFSPSGDFVRLDNSGVNHRHSAWHAVAKVELLEVLEPETTILIQGEAPKLGKRSIISWERFREFLRDDAMVCGSAADEGAKGLKFFLTEVLEANRQEDGPKIMEVMKAFIGELNVNLPLIETHASYPTFAGELLGEALEAVRKVLPAGVRVVVSLAVHEVDAGTDTAKAQPSTEGVKP